MINPCFSRSRGRGAGVDQLPVALKDLLRHADAEDAKSQASAYLRTAFKLMQHELDPIHRANTDNLGPRVDPFEVSLTPMRKAHSICKLTIPIQLIWLTTYLYIELICTSSNVFVGNHRYMCIPMYI
jgi:hypothetical protein